MELVVGPIRLGLQIGQQESLLERLAGEGHAEAVANHAMRAICRDQV